MHGEIFIALGGNMQTSEGGLAETLKAALAAMPGFGINVVRVAPFYRTVALSSYVQPDYVNSVAVIEAALPPRDLLEMLHRIEAMFGRVRRERWAPRTLDLDLLDYRGVVVPPRGSHGADAGAGPLPLALPHPGIAVRAFVLWPLRDVAPGWRHPVTGLSVEGLIGVLGAEAGRGISRISD